MKTIILVYNEEIYKRAMNPLKKETENQPSKTWPYYYNSIRNILPDHSAAYASPLMMTVLFLGGIEMIYLFMKSGGYLRTSQKVEFALVYLFLVIRSIRAYRKKKKQENKV